MKNNTLYASDITYEFEKARIAGVNDNNILMQVKSKEDYSYPENLEYLRDFHDKDTGEVILAYTGTNPDNDKTNSNSVR